LNDIDQRELVFAPLDEKSGVVVLGSYLEYAIQPFSDTELNAYLRRYVIDQFPTRSQDDDINPSHYPDSLRAGTLSSWGLVKAYEEFMDLHQSKGSLRFPFVLSIAVDTLRDVTEHGYDKVPYLKENKQTEGDSNTKATFGQWFYYEAHVNRLLFPASAKSLVGMGQTEKEEKETNSELL